jgi:HD-GYP domain-containing protein (c-di-GMP phosphodiesterase class II)
MILESLVSRGPAVRHNPGDTNQPDDYYLRDVLALGDTLPVVTTTAIYSHHRIKLVDARTRVTSALYERLLHHKLLPSIEQCLSVENGVDVAVIEAQVKWVLANNQQFERMTEFVPEDKLIAAFHHVLLPQPLKIKLTVARAKRTKVFDHSVEVALLAVYLKSMSSDRIPDCALAATAGLLHDIGILHISPDILVSGKQLSESDRHHLYAHPITAYLIVREFPKLPAEVGTAILEHHERLDGSGYPNGLQESRISELGKILMLADSGAALLKIDARGQNSIALRLLRRKFSPQLLDRLSLLFAPLPERSSAEAGPAQNLPLQNINALAEILCAWDSAQAELLAEFPEYAQDAFLNLVNQRLVALERVLLEAGFVPDQMEAFSSEAMRDPSSAREMHEVARESLWQLKDVTLEVRRRWVESAKQDAVHQMITRWLDVAEDRLNKI